MNGLPHRLKVADQINKNHSLSFESFAHGTVLESNPQCPNPKPVNFKGFLVVDI